MSAARNSALLREFIERIDAEGLADALPDYIHDDIALPADTVPNGRQGIDGFREHLAFLHDRIEYSSTVDDIVADGDTVAARITVRGKLLTEFMGLSPNGKSFCADEFMFARFRDGRISRIWRGMNLMNVVEQLS